MSDCRGRQPAGLSAAHRESLSIEIRIDTLCLRVFRASVPFWNAEQRSQALTVITGSSMRHDLTGEMYMLQRESAITEARLAQCLQAIAFRARILFSHTGSIYIALPAVFGYSSAVLAFLCFSALASRPSQPILTEHNAAACPSVYV